MLKGLLNRFGTKKAVAPEALAGQVDALYARASQAWLDGQLAAAKTLAREALALEPNLPALHYLLGSVLLECGKFDAATTALEQALTLRPRFPLNLNAETHAALARARSDLGRGIKPRIEARHAGPARRISVIICSITPEKFERVSANYHRLLADIPHEIVGVHDARSMCEGYTRGMARATGDLLLFSHDDIAILAPDFADRLCNRLVDHELVGVVGSTRLSGEGWIYSRWPHIHGQVAMPRASGYPAPGLPTAGNAFGGAIVTAFHMRGAVTANVQVMDGLLFACSRELAEYIGFDADTFDGWHLYDFDFSYRAWRAGRRTAICHDFLVVHASGGGFDEDWQRYARRFIGKHPEAKASFGEHEAPQLASVAMGSVDEWRLFTQHITARPAG